MAVLKDTVQATMVFDGKQAISELNKLQLEQKNIVQNMQDLKLASQEYLKQEGKMRQMTAAGKEQSKAYEKAAQSAKELKTKHEEYLALNAKNAEVKKSIETVRKELGIVGMTMTQLTKYQKELNYELSNTADSADGYDELKRKIAEVNAAIMRQKSELNESKTAWQNEAAMRNMQEIQRAVGVTGMSVKQLTEYQKLLRISFENAKPNSKEYAAFEKELMSVNAQLGKMNEKVKEAPTLMGYLKNSFHDIVAGNALGTLISEAVMASMQFMTDLFIKGIDGAKKLSDQFADIAKKTGMSAKEVEALNAELSKLDTRTSSSDLREIAIVGGAIGIANKEMADFVKEMDQIVVALGDEFTGGAEEAAKSLGGLKKLFEETKNLQAGDAMKRIGSAINELGNVSSATAPQMTEFANRMGALGNLSPAINDTLGLGSALIDLGLTADIAAGGLSAILIQAGKKDTFDDFAKQIGKTEKQFAALLNSDPNKLILELANSMKGLDNDQVIQTLERLKIGSNEATKVMGLLANQTDLIVERQAIASKGFAEATSITNEFAIKNNNLAGQIEKAEKEIKGFTMALGQGIVPAYAKALELTVQFLTFLKELPQFLEENKALFIALAFGMITYNRAAILASTQGIATMTKALWAKVTAIRAADISFKTLNATMRANPVGAVITSIYLAVEAFMYLYNNVEGFRRLADGMWEYWKWQFGKIFDIVWEFAKALGNIARLIGNVFTLSKEGAVNAAKAVRENFKNLGKEFGSIGEEAGQAFGDGYNRGINKSTAEYQEKMRIQASQQAGIPRSNAKGNTQEVLDIFDLQTAADNWKGEPQKSQAEMAKENAAKDKAAKDKIIEKANQDRFKSLGGSKPKGEAGGKSNKDIFTEELQKYQDYAKTVQRIHEDITAKIVEENGKRLTNIEQTLNRQAEFEKSVSIDLDRKYADELDKLRKHKSDVIANEKLTQIQKKQLLEMYLSQELALAESYAIELGNKVRELNAQLISEAIEVANQQNAIHQEKLDAQLEKELEYLYKSIEVAQMVKEALMSEDEKELAAAQAKYDELIKMAKKYGLDTVELERQKALELQTIKAQQMADDMQAIGTAVGQFGSMFGALQDFLGESSEEMSDFMKGMAFFQISINTAVAISEAIVGAMKAAKAGGPLAPFLMAGYIATAIGAVFSGMAQAKKMLNPEKPKAPKSQAPKFALGGIANGASHAQGGIALVDSLTGRKVGEMEGGEPYMILSKNTYANNKPLINSLLHSSMYRNGAPVLRSPAASLRDNLRKYATGGVVNTNISNTTAPNENEALLVEMQKLNAAFAQFPTLIKAYVVLQELQEQSDRVNVPREKSIL